MIRSVTNQQENIASPFRILLRVPVPWVFVLTYLIGVGLHFLFPLHMLSPTTLSYAKIGGIVLFVTGAFFASWSLLIFHNARTTTTPGEKSASLVTLGPYRFSRNPMYISLILAYLGEAGILGQLWPLIILPCTVAYINWIVIPVEETRLKEVFGEEYAEYCARVRRWI